MQGRDGNGGSDAEKGDDRNGVARKIPATSTHERVEEDGKAEHHQGLAFVLAYQDPEARQRSKQEGQAEAVAQGNRQVVDPAQGEMIPASPDRPRFPGDVTEELG